MEKFIEPDPSQPLFLPVDLREWVPEDDLAHFVLAAVERVPMSRFRVNHRGSGKAQYHPRTMLALLIYSYANGVFGSRRIERAKYRDLGTRFICADVHPDHDTICKFRPPVPSQRAGARAGHSRRPSLAQPSLAGRFDRRSIATHKAAMVAARAVLPPHSHRLLFARATEVRQLGA